MNHSRLVVLSCWFVLASCSGGRDSDVPAPDGPSMTASGEGGTSGTGGFGAMGGAGGLGGAGGTPVPMDGAVPSDAAIEDGAAPDACLSRVPQCDGLDDDCDGMPDDSDEAAGACSFADGIAVCGPSGCELAECRVGKANCNGDSADGCETSTATLTDCGGCRVPCRAANATTTCASGQCRVLDCAEGFADCDGDSANGCELFLHGVEGCGGCETSCAPAFGVAACIEQSCEIATCDELHDDCDGVIANGCETVLEATTSCGACDNACPATNATATCAAGSCAVETCSAEWDDCDQDAATGCESSLNTEEQCGACDIACADGELCRQGSCVALGSPILALGEYYACYVARDGRPWCWGATGPTTINSTPAALSSPSDLIALEYGSYHGCGIRPGGRVGCLGFNDYSRFGNGSVAEVVSVAAGKFHTCAVRRNGTVVCWGANSSGALGHGLPQPAESAAPLQVAGIVDAVQADAYGDATCAVRTTGHVVCWGWNSDAQLGVPPSAGLNANVDIRGAPVLALGVTDAVEVAVGATHGCARISDGSVRCWGNTDAGQLGNGVQTPGKAIAQTVTGLTNAVQLAAGFGHTCALRGDGTVACWGLNDYGQLGDGTRTHRASFVTVPGISTAVQVVTKYFTTCARLDDGSVYCWGSNDSGQIGHEPVSTVCEPYNYEDCSVSLTPHRIRGLPAP